jgi:glycosyltransferase involved in cell wall biosynthesis
VAGAGLDELTLWVDQSDDPARELIASDIVALASESEGFSNSIIQAMALARPVVACRAGGNPEAVVSGETGLLVAPRDVESLAGALLRLARDATLRRAMGQRAAARARERFTRPTMLERTQDLIERVVESQKSKV